MRRLLMNILLFCFTLSVFAVSDTWLVLQLRGGSKVAYIIPGKTQVSFQDNDMIISSPKMEVRYSKASVCNFSFKAEGDVVDGIEPTTVSDIKIRHVADDVVEITGINPTQAIHVYTVNGIEQSPNIIRTGDSATVSLASLPIGVLLITISNADIPAFKVVR